MNQESINKHLLELANYPLATIPSSLTSKSVREHLKKLGLITIQVTPEDAESMRLTKKAITHIHKLKSIAKRV